MQPQSIKQTANVQLHSNSSKPTPTHTPAYQHLRIQEEGRWKIHLRMFKTHPCGALEEGRPNMQLLLQQGNIQIPLYADIYISTSNPKQTEHVPVSDLLIFKKRKHMCAIYVQTKEERKQK